MIQIFPCLLFSLNCRMNYHLKATCPTEFSTKKWWIMLRNKIQSCGEKDDRLSCTNIKISKAEYRKHKSAFQLKSEVFKMPSLARKSYYRLEIDNRLKFNFKLSMCIYFLLVFKREWHPSGISLCGWCKFNRWWYQNNRKKCRCVIKCL